MTVKAPNILIVMADQMAPAFLPIYGHPLVRAPNIQRLARDGVVFDSAYCASPLCAPSREFRRLAPEDAQEASYFAASARIASFR